jgi:hypothetical protein
VKYVVRYALVNPDGTTRSIGERDIVSDEIDFDRPGASETVAAGLVDAQIVKRPTDSLVIISLAPID